MKSYLFYACDFDEKNLHALPRMVYEICLRDKLHQKIIYSNGDKDKSYFLRKDILVCKFNRSPNDIFKLIAKRTDQGDIGRIAYFGSLLGLVSMLRVVKTVKIVYHCYGYVFPLTFKELRTLKGVDIKYDLIELLPHPIFLALIPIILLKVLLNRKNLDLIAVSSKRQYDYLKNIIPSKRIELIKGGVDVKRFNQVDSKEINRYKKKLNPKNKSTILYFGHIKANRGIEEAIVIGRTLTAKGYPVRLIMVLNDRFGTFSKNYLLRKLKDTNKQDLDLLVINKHVADIRYYYKAGDFLVMPYRFSPALPECPLVLLEGMAAGCAVCTYDIGAIGEIIENRVNGVLAKANDSATLVNEIGRLIDDPAERTKIAEKGRQSAKKYDWKLFCRSMSRLIFSQ